MAPLDTRTQEKWGRGYRALTHTARPVCVCVTHPRHFPKNLCPCVHLTTFSALGRLKQRGHKQIVNVHLVSKRPCLCPCVQPKGVSYVEGN